jgi:hypothetical protein
VEPTAVEAPSPAAPAVQTATAARSDQQEADDWAVEAIRIVNEEASLLETIVDEASARATLPKLQAVLQRFEEMKPRAIALHDKLSSADREAIGQKHDAEMAEARQKLTTEIERLRKVPGVEDVMRAIRPGRPPPQ